MIRYTLLFCLLLGTFWLQAQISNDDCFSLIELEINENWCSEVDAFTNVTATASPENAPACWLDQGSELHDVWFSFVALANSANIILNGNSVNPGGSMNNPKFALYEGNCGGNLNLLSCQIDGYNDSFEEMVVTDLTIGQQYFIRVDGYNSGTGSFQICINSYNEVPQPESDCVKAVLLCDKSSFNVEKLVGVGDDTEEVPGTCIQAELSSTWYKWICDDPGSLTFTLTPNNLNDDLDFALFELPEGINDCSGKVVLRCMASGENVGAPFSEWEPCTGPTGLMMNDPDVEELPGCQPGNNNFVQHIDMVEGRAYTLIVNNFSQSGNGFSISWGGTGTFKGPEASIDILDLSVLECDKIFNVDQQVVNELGTVVSYRWNFGVGANPQIYEDEGPLEVEYESFGDKYIALTIETSEGCTSTEIKKIFVNSCCEDFPDLGVVVDSINDLRCYGIQEGAIYVSGIAGNPDYQFSLDGEKFQYSGAFFELPFGEQDIFVRDIKGCVDSITAFIDQPPPLTVDAGPDQTVNLGVGTEISATISPPGVQVTYLWEPSEGLQDSSAQTTYVIPPGGTTYTVHVVDRNGCTASDALTLLVNNIRPIFIPNAFSPNDDGLNDRFTAYANQAAIEIEKMEIYNRWGGKIFEAANIPLNDPLLGWDGMFKGQEMNPGVYVYRFVISFVDKLSFQFSGDVTLVK